MPEHTVSARWNPWTALRRRPEIQFHIDPVAALLGGGIYARRGDQRVIVLDPTLDRRRRRTALAHELIHDERGSGCDHRDAPPTWSAVASREEARVDAEVARRMVPAAELLALGRARAGTGECLTAWEVADEFDVDERTANAGDVAGPLSHIAGTPRAVIRRNPPRRGPLPHLLRQRNLNMLLTCPR